MNVYIHILMRDEKEGRKKQARSNKQQGKTNNKAKHPTCIFKCEFGMKYILMNGEQKCHVMSYCKIRCLKSKSTCMYT